MNREMISLSDEYDVFHFVQLKIFHFSVAISTEAKKKKKSLAL